MTRTIKFLGGIGVNAKYQVIDDGRVVGRIERYGRAGFVEVTTHYGRSMKRTETVAEARAWCEEATFPTAQEVYDTICAEVERERRFALEAATVRRLADLARKVLMDSNEARAELAELLDAIEVLAKDRLKTSQEPDTSGRGHVNVNPERLQGRPVQWPAWRSHHYPDPPK